MNTIKVLAAAVALAGLVGQAWAGEANEVLVTKTSKGSTMSLAFDLVSDGNATSFQVFVNVPGLNEKNEKSANLTKCTVQLPETHKAGAGCVVKDGQVRLGAFSTSNAPLPRGIVPVGTVTLSGVNGTPTLTNIEFARADGKAISTAGHVESDESNGAHAK